VRAQRAKGKDQYGRLDIDAEAAGGRDERFGLYEPPRA